MLRLDLPYLPRSPHGPGNAHYLDFLRSLGPTLDCLYIGLGASFPADARPFLGSKSQVTNEDAIMEDLAQVPGPHKYLLANAAFQAPESLLDSAAMAGLARTIERFARAGQAQGLIYGDPHLLFALSRTAPDLVSDLEAVPSVNLGLDRLDAVLAHLEVIRAAGFKPPSCLFLDRSLNRRLPELGHLSRDLRIRFPHIKIFLLANEGCLYQCPFKSAHDGLMARSRPDMAMSNHRLSRDLGCLPRFHAEPRQILKSPFIRPEDTGLYAGLADGLKLCGRNKDPEFVIRAARAYMAGAYDGNLLELCDVLEELAPVMNLPNEDLPKDFGRTVTQCHKDCETCSYCGDLISRVITHRSVAL